MGIWWWDYWRSIGDYLTQLIDYGDPNIEQSIQAGLINGTVSAIAAPVAGIPSTISNLEKGVIGGTTSAITSVVNEVVFDTSSAIISSEGVS